MTPRLAFSLTMHGTMRKAAKMVSKTLITLTRINFLSGVICEA